MKEELRLVIEIAKIGIFTRYSPRICFTISSLSPRMSNLFAPSFFASSSAVMSARYSATLLVARR